MLKSFWQNYKLVSKPNITPPNMISRVGNLAESEFFDIISQINGLNIYKNKRVKDSNAGLHEIDFIIVDGFYIYLVEFKHWVGSIDISGDGWIQTTKKRTIIHQDPLAKLLKNTQIFKDFLTNNEFDLSSYKILSFVVFDKTKISIPKQIRKNRYILTKHNFLNLLHKNRSKIRPDSNSQNQLKKILTSMTVWSRLHLYGGEILTGSIRYFLISNKKKKLPKHFRVNLDLNWQRNNTISFINALFGRRKKLKIKSKIYKIHPNDSVGFIQAGEFEIKHIKFGLIEKIVKDDEII
ncbi:nuclease-related domain-containing protein [Campylobacter porcelli]|uniref:NERD domain protein n=1 Tax=Campylobacter porcelli TaxID=1660073 RepID=A0A1X9SV71_9BACT|nr:nuclease-related domain-containing protein [Campylobacter sp. RM6137]ARR00076.1 NERD domain protein [Campylobacter sp. RM6137]MEE3744070.1 nuclease-related domain-containing protein [Campylobacter sp. CX2-4855-23]